MSRPVLEITIRLEGGQVLTGRGRNLPATLDRIFNQSRPPGQRKRVTIQEKLKTGHMGPNEDRYAGPLHLTMVMADTRAGEQRETGIAEVRQAGSPLPLR